MVRRFAVSSLLVITLAVAAQLAFAQTPTTMMMNLSRNSSVAGQEVILHMTVLTDMLGTVTNGPIVITDNGVLIGTAEISNSAAAFHYARFRLGTHQLSATYLGNNDYGRSYATQTLQVNQRPAALTLILSATAAGVRTESPVSVAITDTAGFPGGTPGGFATLALTMAAARTGHAAALLYDGTVLLVGGSNGGTVTKSAELYQPGTVLIPGAGFVALTNQLNTARTGHSATSLPDWVLIVGGSTSGAAADALNTMEIFDVVTRSFMALPTQLSTRRTGHTATLLSDGKVLIAGGFDTGGYALNSVEVYDPDLGTVTPGSGSLAAPRAGHTATLLQDGTILFAGGGTISAELYDPVTGATSLTGNLNALRAGHAAALLPDGNVLLTGGVTATDAVATAELYNVVAGVFVPVGGMNMPRMGHIATLLNAALVLVAGGSNTADGTLNSAELYTPSFDPLGTVTLMSDHAFDVFSAPCVATLNGTGTTGCQRSISPAQVGTGTHHITATYPGDALHAGATDQGNLTVVVATPTIIVDDPHPPYDGNPHPAQARALAADGNPVLGTFTFSYNGNSTTPRNAGTYAVVANFTSADPNFNNASGTGTLTIGVGQVTPHVTVENKAFDGTTDATIATRTLTGVQGSDDVTLTGGTAAFDDKHRGDNKTVNVTGLTLSGAASGNYTLSSTSATTTASITARGITVTADTKTKSYGDPDPPLTYTITQGSLAGNDQLTGALTRAPGEAIGSYAIQQGTLVANNDYTLTYVGANLNVGPRSVIVTADAKSVIYGESEPTLTYQVTGGSLLVGDAFTGALTRDPGQNAGTYAITQGTLALNANYALTYQGANFVIEPRPVTVSADPKTKIYGDGDPAFTYQITSGSLVSGDTMAGAPTRNAGENVGAHSIIQGTLVLSPNYVLTYQPANLTITARAITATAYPEVKVYGAPDPALTYAITAGALQFSDAFTGALSRESGENVGTYAIRQGTLTLSSNYTLSYVGSNLTVAPAGTRSSVAVTFTATGLKVTLTATVSPQISGVPAGHVTFTDSIAGALPNGTVTLLNGAASYEVALREFAAGGHNLTAQYDKSDPNFAGIATAVPAAVLVAPPVGATSGQSIPDVLLAINNPTDQTVTLTSLGCEVHPTAGAVPSEGVPVCDLRSKPTTLPPGSTSLTLALGTSAGNATGSVTIAIGGLAAFYGALVGFPAIALLAGSTRRKGRRAKGVACLGLLLVSAILLAACGGGGFSNPDKLQPSTGGGTLPGSYFVVVRYTDVQGNVVPLATVSLNISY